MGSDAFRDRMLAATRVVRGQESDLKRQIAALYENCAKDMEREILKYGEDSLTGQRATAIQKSMQEYVRELWKDVDSLTKRAVQTGAEKGVMIQADMLDDALHGIGITTGPSFRSVFGRTQDEAVASILNGTIYSGNHAGLSRRIWKNEALQQGQVEQIVAKAVAEGRSAPQLARELEAYVNPKAMMPDHWNDIYENLPFVYKVDYNAKRLAVTALNHAYYQGAVMAARDNPFAEFLHWQLSSGHEIYDVCDLYMEHDEGLGRGNFSLDNVPLPHPFCRCTWYIDSSKSLEEIGQELGRWIYGESNPQLDRAFGEWKTLNNLPTQNNTAIMKWKDAEFPNDNLLDIHYGKHAKEFGTISKEQYVEQARALLMQPEGEDVLQLVRSDGSISKYRPSTNEFVVGNEDGTIRTYFLPRKRSEYWKEELERNE